MNKVIDIFIAGTPAVKKKTRGNRNTPKEWKNLVKEQTKDLPKIGIPSQSRNSAGGFEKSTVALAARQTAIWDKPELIVACA